MANPKTPATDTTPAEASATPAPAAKAAKPEAKDLRSVTIRLSKEELKHLKLLATMRDAKSTGDFTCDVVKQYLAQNPIKS